MPIVKVPDDSGHTMSMLSCKGRYWSPRFSEEVMENINDFPLREDDVLLCSYCKSADNGCLFEYIRGWEKGIADNPELPVFVCSYEDLKENHLSEVRRLSKFLGKDYSDEFLQQVCDYTTFDKMKEVKGENSYQTKEGNPVMYRKGHYLYTYVPYGMKYKSAVITTPTLTANEAGYCLQASVIIQDCIQCKLEVRTTDSYGNQSQTLLQVTSQLTTNWWRFELNIPGDSQQVHFISTLGIYSNRGVGKDNVSLAEGSCEGSKIINCDFSHSSDHESVLCYYEQDTNDDFDWQTDFLERDKPLVTLVTQQD